MADPLSTVKGKKKIKKDLMSKNCSLTEFNGERLSSSSSRLPGLRGQKYSSNSNLEKLSFISEKDFATYENYKVDYSNYLLKKLQSHLLLSNKKQKEDNLKRCLVSLKLELEAVLKDHVNLHKSSAYARVYMDIIQECNKRIELGENILKLFEENKLDDLFMSVSSILDPIINQLLLVEINKNDIEKIFSQDVIGENSNLIECLKKIHSLSAKNKDTIDNIAAEIVKIEDLCKENSVLREGCQNMFDQFTGKIIETGYETNSNILKKAYERRLNRKDDFKLNDENIFKIEELFQAMLKPISSEQINSFQLSKVDGFCSEKPNGTSTPEGDYAKKY